MTGGAFMGCMMAQNAKTGPAFDPARVFVTIASVTGASTSDRDFRIAADVGTTIDWGDGETSVYPSGVNYVSHYLPAGGPYTVEVSGGTTRFGCYAGPGVAATGVNIGDSVTRIGANASIGFTFKGASPEEIAGMRNVEGFDGPVELHDLKRFSVPPKIEELAVPAFTFPALEKFSLGNVRRLAKSPYTGSGLRHWTLGHVKTLDFSGITAGTTKDSAPVLSNNAELERVDWGSIGILPGSSTAADRGPFYNCPRLAEFTHDPGAKFGTTTDAHSYYSFSDCPSLQSRPIDIGDADSTTSSRYRFFYIYENCPQLFPDHKASIDLRMFDTGCARNCGIEELTLHAGPTDPNTPFSVSWFTSTIGNGYQNVQKVVMYNNFYTTATTTSFDGDINNSLREIVFPRRMVYTPSMRFLLWADEFANPVVVRFPENTMSEVKDLTVYGRTVKEFPFGCPAGVTADRLYFACKDGNMDKDGNVI